MFVAESKSISKSMETDGLRNRWHNILIRMYCHQVRLRMRTGLILALIAMLAFNASAGSVRERLGSYDVSFDLNTTAKYSVAVEGPSNGVTENGIKFIDYNLSVDGGDSLIYLVLRGYKINNMTDIDSNKTNINTVTGTMNTILGKIDSTQRPSVKLYQLPIDGHTGVLEAGRFSSNEVFACVSYFLDNSTSPIKKTNCRVFSTYPWEFTREMLYSLHVTGPA